MNNLNLEQEMELKQMTNQEENMIVVTLDLKSQW